MQAILTKYLADTRARGARICATTADGRHITGYDYAFDTKTNHRLAAEMLVGKLGWNSSPHTKLLSGSLPDGSYCHLVSVCNSKGELK
jgi:hypothetical protein